MALNDAKIRKDDEYYTSYDAINEELGKPEHNYRQHFKDAVVYCNCDDPEWSAFWQYFVDKFKSFGLKKLISTHYEKGKSPSYKMEYYGDGNEPTITTLYGDEEYTAGDFRSKECIEILKEADIVCTNPPFSLFNPYIHQLLEYGKKFIIIGNKNAVTHKEIFPLMRDNKIWWGNTHPNGFTTPSGEIAKNVNGMCRWYSNLDIPKIHQNKMLGGTYNEKKYPKYCNYDAIDCKKIVSLPDDYFGIIGVPITFFDCYCPSQFEVLECHEPALSLETIDNHPDYKRFKSRQFNYNGEICQKVYHRIFIKRKVEE